MEYNRIFIIVAAAISIVSFTPVHAVSIQPGWPVDIGKAVTSMVVADVDSNATNGLELVLGSGITYPTAEGYLRIYRSDNSSLPGWPKKLFYDGEIVSGVPVVGDLFSDGGQCVVAGTSRGGLYAWYANGTFLWRVSVGGSVYSSPTIVDLDDDPSNGKEIIFGSDDRYLHVLHGNGTKAFKIPTGESVRSSPAVGDIDGDGDLEIVVGSYDGKVYAWHNDGVPVIGWPRSVGIIVSSSPALCDIDGDHRLEVVVAAEDYKVFAFEGDGSTVQGEWPSTTGGYITSSPACGDLDNDGKDEVTMGSWDGKIYTFYGNGTLMWSQSVGAAISSSPAIGDIDGDGDLEVVTGSSSSKIYAFHHDGSDVGGWPLNGSDIFQGSPVIADMDHDNITEIASTTSTGMIYMWDTGSSYNGSNIPWPMFRRDQNHLGSSVPSVSVNSPAPMGYQWVNEDETFLLNISRSAFSLGQMITFNASASDPLGNIVSYEWTSNHDGPIGGGRSINVSNLSRGMHEIEVAVRTDRGGLGYGRTSVFVYDGSIDFSDNTTLFNITNSGLIDFTPDNSEVGDYTVNISLNDNMGFLGNEIFDLSVINTNDAPVINTSSPPVNVTEDDVWTYDFDAADDDIDSGYGDQLRWSVNNSNMSINTLTGEVQWTPDKLWANKNHSIRVTVTDSAGAQDSLDFTVYVIANHTEIFKVSGQKDRQNYYQNDNVTLTAYVYNFYDKNATADTVKAVIEKPCGATDTIILSNQGWNVYEGTYAGSFRPGHYKATITAERSFWDSGNYVVEFNVSEPVPWNHYFNISVKNNNGVPVSDAPVEYTLNFTEVLNSLGLTGKSFDNNSIRVFETDSLGRIITEVPYEFDRYIGDPDNVNVALNKPAWADSSSGSNTPDKAVDGTTSTWWRGTTAGTGQWGLDFTATTHVYEIYIEAFDRISGMIPRDFSIALSDDDVTYTTIEEVTGNSRGKLTYHFSEVSGRYLLLNITATRSSSYAPSLEEVQVKRYLNSYDAGRNALGNLTWVMDGTTGTGERRYYQVRFGTVEEGPKLAPDFNLNYSSFSVTPGLDVTLYNASNNTSPNASFGTDPSPLRNTPTTFNASNSSDPDGDLLYYYWDFGECSGGFGKVLNYSFSAPGSKEMTLVVRDSKGGISESNATVSVTNNPPVLNPIDPLSAAEGVAFNYTVSASDTDPLTYYSNSTFFTINATTGLVSFTPLRSDIGNHSIRFTVSDGYINTSEVVPFTVNITYHPPVLDFIPSQAAVAGEVFALYINASDADFDYGENLSFSYNCTSAPNPDPSFNCNYFNLTKVSDTMAGVNWTPQNVSTYGGPWPSAQNGTHWFNFSVTDSQGLLDYQSVPLMVLRNITMDQPPVIVNFTPGNFSGINETQTLNISITADDANEGTVLTIYLYRDGELVNYTFGGVLNYSWPTNYTSAGEYEFLAWVTDGKNTVSLSHNYTVENVNRPPDLTVLSPANNSHFQEGAPISFVTTVTDPDTDDTLIYSIRVDGTEISDQANISYLWGYSDAGRRTINISVSDGWTMDYEVLEVSVHEPDLRITRSNVTLSGAGRNLTATVENLGNVTTGPFPVFFYLDGVPFENITLNLGPYSNQNVTVNWTAGPGIHTLAVIADPDNIIKGETSEENNMVIITMSIAGGKSGTSGSFLDGGVKIVGPSSLGYILADLGLDDSQFYSISPDLAGAVVLLGKFPASSASYPDSNISRNLNSTEFASILGPAVLLEEPSILARDLDIEGDIYSYVARQVREKYRGQSIKTLVVTRGDLPYDSMAAVAYARSMGAPILLTRPGEVPAEVKEVIEALTPKKIVVVGGPDAISPEVEEVLTGYCEVLRIGGTDRYATAVEMALSMDPLTIVIVQGEGQPLPESAIMAWGYKAPVLYVKGDEVPGPTMEYIQSHKKNIFGTEMNIIGYDLDMEMQRELGEIIG